MSVKTWLVIGGVLVAVGLIACVIIMSTLNWDFSKLGTETYETNTYTLKESFRNISIYGDEADIRLAVSDDGVCRVVCAEPANRKHSVSVENGLLTVKALPKESLKDYIHIGTRSPKITVYLPESSYGALFIDSCTGDVTVCEEVRFQSIDIALTTGNVTNYASAEEGITIKTTTGDIRVERIASKSLKLSVTTGDIKTSEITCAGDIEAKLSTGDIKFSDVTCATLSIGGGTGDIVLKNVIATAQIAVEVTTGDVKLDGCDAAELRMKTDTGDVTGTLLSEKVFLTSTDTGSVDVPKTVNGGKCEISTDTGDIKIKLR